MSLKAKTLKYCFVSLFKVSLQLNFDLFSKLADVFLGFIKKSAMF